MQKEVKSYKLKSLPNNPIPDAILYIKADGEETVSTYITDINGAPYPLKDIGGSGASGIQTIVNTDGTISVLGTDNTVLNLSTAIKNIINSALQSGDNISELVNDVNYITIADIPSQIVDLQSVPSATNVVITNTNGADATILPATTTDAGILLPGEKVKLNNLSGINSGNQTSIVGISGTKSEYNTSLTDGDFLFVGDVIAYTDEQAQDAIGNILLDTPTIDLTYDDATPNISASVKPNSITPTELADNINLTEFVNNAGFENTTQLNTRDTNNRNRANHTGTQAISTVINLQNSLDAKENIITAGTTSQYWRGDKTWQTLDKTAVGLANVDNTSDLSKPISTATQTALNLKENLSNKTGIVTGNEASTTLYLHISGTIAYFQQKLTDSIFGSFINSLTAKTTPIDADSISIVDSADTNKAKKVTLSNLKSYLKTYFDTFYATVANLALKQDTLVSGTNIKTVNGFTLIGSGNVTAGTRVYNVKDYGALANGTTDDTVAIQNAINACNSAGGGIVYFPNGIYFIDGTLDTNSQSQIYFPLNSLSSSITLKTIKLLGETPPNQYSNPFNALGANDHSDQGVIIKSNLLTAGNIIGCRNETVSWGLFNFIHVNIENISIRIRSMTSGTDVQAVSTGINMGSAAYFDSSFFEVCTTSQMKSVLEPASTCYGLIMPKTNNFALCTAKTFNIYGVYIAVDCYEHTSLNNFMIDVCVIGLNMNNCNHSINVTKGLIQRSRYNIRCQNSSKFFIDHVSVEDDYAKSISTPTWNATLFDVQDIDNTSTGRININVVRSNFGTDNSVFKINSDNSKVKVTDLNGVSLTKTTISFASMLAYWKFENNYTDISGKGIIATGVNTPTFTAGKIGNALTLASASSQYVNAGATGLSNTGVFTICGWFKINTTAAAFQTLFNKGDGTSKEYNCFYTKTGNVLSFVNYNVLAVSGTVSATITPGTFFFLCCEIIGNTIKMSINNGVSVTASCPVPSSASAKNLLIGSADPVGSTLDGQIDELCIFNRQLSPEEKSYIYNNGLGNSLIY